MMQVKLASLAGIFCRLQKGGESLVFAAHCAFNGRNVTHNNGLQMALIVQKYGGTSVGNTDRIKNVARRVAEYRKRGDQIVVVVSAMSGVTDNLIKLSKEIMPLPSEREMDMLLATGEQTTIALTAMALHSIDIPAVSLTGAQAGIVTMGCIARRRSRTSRRSRCMRSWTRGMW
jgi:aspartokinase